MMAKKIDIKKIILKSNLFDKIFYLKEYQDVRRADQIPIDHYCKIGITEDRKPNEHFDPIWYREHYSDVKDDGAYSLIHYIIHGKKENRFISEKEKNEYELLENKNFDIDFYKNSHEDLKKQDENFNPLLHYIRHGKYEKRNIKFNETIIDEVKIVEESFDSKYYLDTNPDVKSAGVNPFEHYIYNGWKEGRKPNIWFEPTFYLKKYDDIKNAGVEPLTHYITMGQHEGRQPKYIPELSKKSYFSYISQQNSKKDYQESYVEFIEHDKLQTDIKLIAWYLPQFHPIPANDKTWGKGFTEWTNVSKALPQYEGHYQPRLPGELGYYDLRLIEIQKRQIELAKNYGLHGFCYHYYWFDGEKVMDTPLQQVLDNPDLDFPFCINWANENWTKRWDGLDQDVIYTQNHTLEDDIAFLEAIKPILTDKRYIKVNNKPLLMLYRPSLFPDIKATVARWREHAVQIGIGELYLVMTHSFENIDPTTLGFDAAVDFAPNHFKADNIIEEQQYYNKDFTGNVYDYDSLINYNLEYEEPSYTKFRSLCPSWDNEARKPGKGTVFQNATPAKYKKWLEHLVKYTEHHRKGDEKLLFVNAWNEWAEGAYLEPDRKLGYAYLEATYDILKKKSESKKLIVVSHDAYFHGAQFLALNIAQTLKEYFNYEIEILLCGEGGLIPEFEKVGVTHHLYKLSVEQQEVLLTQLYQNGFTKAIANTSVVGNLVEQLHNKSFEVLSLIHEMEAVIKQYGLEGSIDKIAKFAQTIIFPSEIVKQDFQKFVELNDNKTFLMPQGLFRKNKYKYQKNVAREKLLQELQIPHNSKIILNLAYGDYRKGIDIFVETGIKAIQKNKDLHFLWVGHYQDELVNPLKEMIKANNYERNFHFVGLQKDIEHYYAGSDIFYLTSREDPFPSVVLDAMNVGLPILAFKGAGGFEDVLSQGCGILVEKENFEEIYSTINSLLTNHELYNTIAQKSMEMIEQEYCFVHYLFKLLELLDEDIKKVSVVIPNYNYEKYIEERIESIAKQTYPIFEIVYLDDKSVDGSLVIAETTLQKYDIPFKIFKNDINSGSVYKQWLKGIRLAQGDFIWIAEADDLASETFLETLLEQFNELSVALAYSQSAIIDENGKEIYSHVRSHTDAIDQERWEHDYIEKGDVEIRNALAYRNTIPNVSACVFAAKALQESAGDELTEYRYCGDWYLYIKLLQKYDIAFISHALNHFRKHASNVTTTNTFKPEYIQEIMAIKRYISDNYVFNQSELDKMMKIFSNDFIEHNPNKDQILASIPSTLETLSEAKSKKISFVTFNEEFGGSEVLWFELSQKLGIEGHDIQVFCPKRLLGEKRLGQLMKCGIDVQELEVVDSNTLNGIVSDLVIFSTGDHNAGGALFSYCIERKIDYIIINQLVKETMWPDNQEFLQTLFRGYQYARQTFFTSKNNIEIFEKKMQGKLHNAKIHFNPIDINRNDYVSFPAVDTYWHVAFPARLLTVHKGQDLLLEVLSQPKWKERNLVVNFYGQGPDEEKLKTMAQQYGLTNVRFLGHVDSMRKIWEVNHAFILTSYMEGLPIVLLSAMFAGRVPIVTNVGGNSEVVVDNVNGFISRDVSIEAIDELLERAWVKRDNWETFGQRASAHIATHYPSDPIDHFIKEIKL